MILFGQIIIVKCCFTSSTNVFTLTIFVLIADWPINDVVFLVRTVIIGSEVKIGFGFK